MALRAQGEGVWRPIPADGLAAWRLLLAAPFVVSGVSKPGDLNASSTEVGTLVLFGLAGPVAAFVIVVQFGGSAMLLSGARWSAIGGAVLAALTVTATLLAHARWLKPVADRQQDMSIVFEHLAIVGGLLLAARPVPDARS